MNKKRVIFLLLIIIWLLIIFMFSSSSGSESNNLSKSLINKVINVYEYVTNSDINSTILVKKLNYPVRKLAHYTIFLILGIFIYLFINTFNINKKALLSIFLCLIFASFDEIHQIVSINRTPKILDVFIDLFGSITSIYILNKKSRGNYNEK